MKECRKCGVELVVGETWYASYVKYNDCICKKCKKAYTRQYYAKHKEEYAAYMRQYRKDNAEEIAAYLRQWREEHKEEIAAYGRQYQLENPKKCCEIGHRYRARKLNAIIEDVDEQKIYELYDHACIYCGSEENLSLDHVVSLAGGGAHCEDNLVVACRSCNSSKNDTPLEEWAQTRPDLQVWVM